LAGGHGTGAHDAGVQVGARGRTSPPAGSAFTRSQFEASLDESDAATEQQARRRARDRGRFTRNYVVQGTAAEWALCWLAETRRSLLALTAPGAEAAASGPAQSGAPHIAFFLHDEIIVHTPAELADRVAAIVTDAAARAGRLLFGEFPIDFPLDVRIAPDAGKS
jgi:DNA polymerase I